MQELGSWQASGVHQFTNFRDQPLPRGRGSNYPCRRQAPGAPASFSTPPLYEIPACGCAWLPRSFGTANGPRFYTPPYLLAAHRRPLLMASARHRTEWNQFAVGLPPAGVLGCPYPYRLIFACSTCSGVPLLHKSLIYKGFNAGVSWNTDSVPACSKVFQVFRFWGAQRIGEQAANPRQPWATACLAVLVLVGGRHDAQHWRHASSSGASCSACWSGAGVQPGQAACGRASECAPTGRAGTSSRNAHGSPRLSGKGRRWPAGAVARSWRSRCWPSSSSRVPAGRHGGNGEPVQGAQAGRPARGLASRCAPVGRAGANSRNAHDNPRPAGERRGVAVLSCGRRGV